MSFFPTSILLYRSVELPFKLHGKHAENDYHKGPNDRGKIHGPKTPTETDHDTSRNRSRGINIHYKDDRNLLRHEIPQDTTAHCR
jgi:hypothetical protein